MKLSKFLLFFPVLLISADAFAAQGNTCSLYGDKLYSCTAFECTTSLPEARDRTIHNRIIGLAPDGSCVSEQSNPDGEKVICRYSEESRKFLGLRLKKAGSDLVNMPESSQFEENILADIFHNECDVVSARGGDDKPRVNEGDAAALEAADYNEAEEAISPEDRAVINSERTAPAAAPAITYEDNGDLVEE